MWRTVALVAVFNGSCGKGGQRGCARVRGAPVWQKGLVSAQAVWETENTYGPMSDGVTGSDGGGGRLINVGVDILSS